MMSFIYQNAPRHVTMPPAGGGVVEEYAADGDGETLGEYGDRMRDKFSREYTLALSKSLAPAFTYKRNSSR